jgi:lipopolysaccharide export system protein LptA
MIRPRHWLWTVAACAALVVAAPPPAGAQGLTGLQSGKGPLEITADRGIEWRRAERLYVARGNARAARGSFELYADTLTAYYRDLAGGGTDVFRIVAKGRVRIVSPGETVYADHGVYQVDRGLVLLRGRDLRLETQRDLVRARDSLEFWERQRVAVARGEALARRDDQEIRADVLTAYFRPGADGRLEMRTVKADGNVRISTATEFARGDGGVYYVKEQLATLSGAVKISRGENLLSGEYAEVDLASGVSRLLGAVPGQPGDARVRGLLVPDALGKPGNGS